MLAVLLLALLEAARFYGLKEDAEEWTLLAAESLAAAYQPVLFEEYRLFFLDGCFGQRLLDTGRMEDEMEVLLHENLTAKDRTEGAYFYRMQVQGIDVEKYRLATDEAGKVFEMQAANAMKHEMGLRAAEEIRERILQTQKQSGQGGETKEAIADADTALSGLAAEKEAKEAETAREAEPAEAPPENPLDILKKLCKQGILALVLPQGKTVSAKAVSVDNCLQKRSLDTGNFPQTKQPGWYERILMQEFIKPFAGNAVEPKEEGALSYGTEYIICGKESDERNLKGTVKKLLLLREGLNLLQLQLDETKQGEAAATAAALAGIAANPAVIAVVKEGILAAWAYAESLCDVKALLAGGRIPLLKDGADWQTQLSNLAEAVSAEQQGAGHGLSYEDYLDTLLYAKSVKQAAYRSMDLMEWHLKSQKGFEDCRMDAMIAGFCSEVRYEADTLFLGMFGEGGPGGFRFSEKARYVYEQ